MITPSQARRIAVFTFCLFSALNGLSWLMFDPAVDAVQSLFAVDETQLRWLSSWQPIVYVVAFAPLTALICRANGLRRCLVLASACQVAGACAKLLASTVAEGALELAMLHSGQILSAVASPVAIGAPPLLAAQWYGAGGESSWTVIVTGLAVVSNNGGNALAYALVPSMADTFGFQAVCFFELCLALVVATCVFVTWRLPCDNVGTADAPVNTGDSVAPADEIAASPSSGPGVFLELISVARNRCAVVLCCVYAWSSGGYVAWMSMMDSFLPLLSHFSDELVGLVTLWSTLAYIAGGLVSSFATQRWFPRNMREVILVSTVCNAAASAAFAATCPTPLWVDPPMANGGAPVTVLLASLCGFFSGAAAPLFYELAAEATYPSSEGVSGNAMSLMENIGALVMYQAVANFAPTSMINIIYFLGLCAASGLVGFGVTNEHRRAIAFSPVKDDASVEQK